MATLSPIKNDASYLLCIILAASSSSRFFFFFCFDNEFLIISQNELLCFRFSHGCNKIRFVPVWYAVCPPGGRLHLQSLIRTPSWSWLAVALPLFRCIYLHCFDVSNSRCLTTLVSRKRWLRFVFIVFITKKKIVILI